MKIKNALIKLLGGITPETEQSYLEQIRWLENKCDESTTENNANRFNKRMNRLFNVQEYDVQVFKDRQVFNNAHILDDHMAEQIALCRLKENIGKFIVENQMFTVETSTDPIVSQKIVEFSVCILVPKR